jgi:heme/copper-type cytochrome/quinol oxidase subunit 2
MNARRPILRVGLTAAMCVLADAAIHACPICFQIEDAHVVGGIRAAVGVLMGVTVAVMAPVIVFAVRFARRDRSQAGGDHHG